MSKLLFNDVKFILSAASSHQFPNTPYCEIAFVGRSNVGKSSLINLLTQKKTAKVSGTPGKTQEINFFIIDGKLTMADLPGYGFAKVPQEMKEKWVELTQAYLEHRDQLRLVLLLLDSRHPPKEEDIQILSWAENKSFQLAVVLTKTDKLSQKEIELAKKSYSFLSKEVPLILTSSSNKKGRDNLIKLIESQF